MDRVNASDRCKDFLRPKIKRKDKGLRLAEFVGGEAGNKEFTHKEEGRTFTGNKWFVEDWQYQMRMRSLGVALWRNG